MEFILKILGLTKWIPLSIYEWDGSQYIVFVRGNMKTGMLSFKTKKITASFTRSYGTIMSKDLVDTKTQWEEIYRQINISSGIVNKDAAPLSDKGKEEK